MTPETSTSPGAPPEAPGRPADPPGESERRPGGPGNANRAFYGTCLSCALVAGADLLVHRHPVFSVEALFAFYGAYGFAASVGLALAAKELRKLLKRDEAYYGDDA